jgi:hypothetical protein
MSETDNRSRPGGLRRIPPEDAGLGVPGSLGRAYPIHTIKDLIARPRARWLVKGLIRARELVVIFGKPGCGKSFTVIALAASVSSGRPFLGREVERGRVVYLALEGVDGLLPRLTAAVGDARLLEAEPFAFNFHWAEESVSFVEPDSFERFLEAVKALDPKPVLVAIDMLALGILPGDETSPHDMGLFVRACNRIRAEVSAAVLVLHHPGWNATRERGSNVLRGESDLVFRLDEQGGTCVLHCEKARDMALLPPIGFRLELVDLPATPDGQPVTSRRLVAADVLPNLASDRDKLSAARRQILDLLRDKFNTRGATLKELIAAVEKSRQTVYGHRKFLIAKGFVTKTGRGDEALYAATSNGSEGVVS